MTDSTDHDLLITIANDSKWIKDWALNHEKADGIIASELKSIARAAHIRVDKVNERFNWLIITGIMAIIIFALTIWFRK